jgi:Putative DNA-binding domain
MAASPKKNWHESAAKFFEDPTRVTLRELLQDRLGENGALDFKEKWIEDSKLAKHLLGFGNSGGGCIVFGVNDNSESIGLSAIKDDSQFRNGVKKFLPPALLEQVSLHPFSYTDSEYPTLIGKKFQILVIEDDPTHLPYVASADGSDISSNTIYIRRGTSSEKATYIELQECINRRLSTGYSSQKELDLQAHLEQLKVLYKHVRKQQKDYAYPKSLIEAISPIISSLSSMQDQIVSPNPEYDEKYTEKGLNDFIKTMIDNKKLRIEAELNVHRLWEYYGDPEY